MKWTMLVVVILLTSAFVICEANTNVIRVRRQFGALRPSLGGNANYDPYQDGNYGNGYDPYRYDIICVYVGGQGHEPMRVWCNNQGGNQNGGYGFNGGYGTGQFPGGFDYNDGPPPPGGGYGR